MKQRLILTIIGLLMTCLVGKWYFHYIQIILDNNDMSQMLVATIIFLILIYFMFELLFTIKPFSKK